MQRSWKWEWMTWLPALQRFCRKCCTFELVCEQDEPHQEDRLELDLSGKITRMQSAQTRPLLLMTCGSAGSESKSSSLH